MWFGVSGVCFCSSNIGRHSLCTAEQRTGHIGRVIILDLVISCDDDGPKRIGVSHRFPQFLLGQVCLVFVDTLVNAAALIGHSFDSDDKPLTSHIYRIRIRRRPKSDVIIFRSDRVTAMKC